MLSTVRLARLWVVYRGQRLPVLVSKFAYCSETSPTSTISVPCRGLVGIPGVVFELVACNCVSIFCPTALAEVCCGVLFIEAFCAALIP